MGWAGGGTAPGLFGRRWHFIVTELEEVFVMKAELGGDLKAMLPLAASCPRFGMVGWELFSYLWT